MNSQLTCAAVYDRVVNASLQRVWENVHDWEHLPWLHGQAFCAIDLLDSGNWGWRARVQVPPREANRHLLIELRRQPDAPTYHTRTLDGPGSGSDIRTTLHGRGDHETQVHVEFWIPEREPTRLRAAGDALVTLYTTLWDQDERMMQRRQFFLDGKLGSTRSRPPAPPISLGPISQLRAGLPRSIEVEGQRFQLREHAGELVAHAGLCPHLGGPLEEAQIFDGHLICPWHGYRFSLADGRNPDGRACAPAQLGRVEVSEEGEAQLVFSPPPSA